MVGELHRGVEDRDLVGQSNQYLGLGLLYSVALVCRRYGGPPEATGMGHGQERLFDLYRTIVFTEVRVDLPNPLLVSSTFDQLLDVLSLSGDLPRG